MRITTLPAETYQKARDLMDGPLSEQMEAISSGDHLLPITPDGDIDVVKMAITALCTAIPNLAGVIEGTHVVVPVEQFIYEPRGIVGGMLENSKDE